MHKEINSLQHNDTWQLTNLPSGKRAIGNKWVYKVKLNSDGTLKRFKARLVIQGNHQRAGVDYSEIFSPVIKMAIIRSIIALASSRKWSIHQLDINNVFLHGDLTKEVNIKVL